ncbi:MAG TPA: MBL fold metallo-hydrolase [Azospirillaceae bacterium]|nr:MBL fold metallo-hydrolase [Azospirillaceae bacterium]
MASAALDFAFTAPPPEGTATEVAPGLLWARMPLPFALDHVNVWLLADGDGWAVVDCGVHGTRTHAAWEKLLEGKRLTRVVATHFHPDHLGVADWLCRRDGARLVMTEREWTLARFLCQPAPPGMVEEWAGFHRAAGLSEQVRQALSDRGNQFVRGVPAVPERYHRIAEGDAIPIGNTDWRIITGSGHSPEMACLFDVERRILISGDQVLPSISPNVAAWPDAPEADPLADFLESLRRLRALPEDTLVLPSHGLPFRGLHERIDQLTAHHAERLERTLEVCRTPVSVADLAKVLFERELDLHQLAFALGEALAHLNRLVHQGSLVRETGPGGVWLYRAA